MNGDLKITRADGKIYLSVGDSQLGPHLCFNPDKDHDIAVAHYILEGLIEEREMRKKAATKAKVDKWINRLFGGLLG